MPSQYVILEDVLQSDVIYPRLNFNPTWRLVVPKTRSILVCHLVRNEPVAPPVKPPHDTPSMKSIYTVHIINEVTVYYETIACIVGL